MRDSTGTDLLQYIASEVTEIRREARERDEARTVECRGLRVDIEKLKSDAAVEKVKQRALSIVAGALGGNAKGLVGALTKLF